MGAPSPPPCSPTGQVPSSPPPSGATRLHYPSPNHLPRQLVRGSLLPLGGLCLLNPPARPAPTNRAVPSVSRETPRPRCSAIPGVGTGATRAQDSLAGAHGARLLSRAPWHRELLPSSEAWGAPQHSAAFLNGGVGVCPPPPRPQWRVGSLPWETVGRRSPRVWIREGLARGSRGPEGSDLRPPPGLLHAARGVRDPPAGPPAPAREGGVVVLSVNRRFPYRFIFETLDKTRLVWFD